VDKLSLVEQGNFGGAGGFTRCMLEAGRTAGATHVLLMDDDAIIEPESVHRAATFQSLAREEIGVGGQMLDLQQPLQLYETAGQILFSQILMGPQVHGVRVDRTHSLQMLHRIYATYAGWWFFCLPLSLLTRHGLPLPLFIRGDDIEYGLRLTKAGVQSVMLPGVAVWHEPFYAKRRNWLAYYDQRNMFAVGAVHFPSSRWSLARLMLVRLLKSLLTMDYYGAWLLCRAIEDYRRGPDLLDADPQHIHRQLLDERKTYPLEKVSRNFAFPVTTPPVRGRIKRLLQIGLGLFRGLFRRSTPASTPITTAIDWRDENWLTLAPMNVVAIDDPFSDAYVVLRRNRGAFWRLLGRGLWAVLRTVIAHGRILRRWQAAFARLTTSEFWHRYLGVARQDEAEASRRRTAA
jgi:galactofuranosylgalactofuranosylrhamnosyl-N-acetylglucosaminyl-diphospho-decaprenol beta-1,5/1,6-galactofuranosyltransferase